MTQLVDDFNPPWFLSNQGIEAYQRAENFVVLDFETTNLLNGLACEPNNKIVLACWTVVKDGVATEKFKFGDEYEQEELLADIRATDFIVAHNCQFELAWLHRCGLDLHDVLCYDTMVMEWVLHGNLRVPYSLDETAKRRGIGGKESLVSMLIKLKVCPSTIIRSWLLKYCKIDVALCLQLFYLQSVELTEKNLWPIALSRNITIPVLVDMHLNGLELDREAVIKEDERLRGIIEDLGQRLDVITGGINLGSPKQLGIFLYQTAGFDPVRNPDGTTVKTPGGSPSVAQDVIARLQAKTPEQEEFLKLFKEYNHASVLLSKNIGFFAKVSKFMDGKFYGLLNHCRTKTHRLASSGIALLFPGEKKLSQNQIQNLPRQYKSLFTAHDPDYEILEADGAGMEFRIATILGRDEQGASDIINGVDIHAFTRDTMNAAWERMGSPKRIDRQGAKPQTFRPLFWGMGNDKAEQEYAEAFKKKYHQIYETQRDWTLEVADTKRLVTPYGMIFYWPDCTMNRRGYVKYTTEIVNIPIQGLATAEVIPVALVHFWHRVRGMPVYIWNSVHDSIASRVRRDYMDVAKFHSKLAMTSDVYSFFKEVYNYEFTTCPLGVGMKCGSHWGKADKEEIWDVWPSGRERYSVEEAKVKTIVYDTGAN
jgi:DNA polymerase I-like protein with 3'-5' exonuclease and polymerase domains